MALKVSSSVIWDFSVTVAGVVVRKASVTSTDVSVTASLLSDVLLLIVDGAAVRPRPMSASLVWDNISSGPSWFCVLELRESVEDSVETPTLEPESWSVPEMLPEPPTGEVNGGVEETNTSVRSVPGSVCLRVGVESELSSDVDVC